MGSWKSVEGDFFRRKKMMALGLFQEEKIDELGLFWKKEIDRATTFWENKNGNKIGK